MKPEEDSSRIIIAHESTERDYQLEEKYSIRRFFIGMAMLILGLVVYGGIIWFVLYLADALPY